MIRINLLPFRAARSKENIRRQVSVFLLSMVLLVVILVIVNSHLGGRVETLEERLGDLQAEVEIYEERAQQVEKFKEELEELNKKIDIVNDLKALRKDPPELLAELTELVVSGRMQLLSMSFSQTQLRMEGLAMDNETIAVFMRRLEQSDRFSSVTLSRSAQQMEQGVEMKRFGISCRLADGD